VLLAVYPFETLENRLYEKYLEELVFEEPIAREILNKILDTEGHTLPAQFIREHFGLSKEKYQECMLLLEFHFAACATFTRKENKYSEQVGLFKEYGDFLKFQKDTRPKALSESDITEQCAKPFSFLCNLHAFTQNAQVSLCSTRLEEKLEFLKKTSELHAFFDQPHPEQAFMLFRKSLEVLSSNYTGAFGILEKNVHELERALRDLMPKNGWVTLDSFVQTLTAPIGTQNPVTLKKMGKKWQYARPSYTEEELQFIKHIVFDLFFEMGIISIGLYQEKAAFKITGFGYIALGE